MILIFKIPELAHLKVLTTRSVSQSNSSNIFITGDISASITFPAGTSIGYAWGYNPKTEMFYGVPQLAPGQSYSGVGFITAGMI